MSTYHFDIDATFSVDAETPEQAERIFHDYINFISSGIPRSDFELYDYEIRVDTVDNFEIEENFSPADSGSYTSFSSVVLQNAVQDVSQEIIQQASSYTPMVTPQQDTLPSIPGYARLRTTRS